MEDREKEKRKMGFKVLPVGIKRQAVSELESGMFSRADLAAKYGVSSRALGYWVQQIKGDHVYQCVSMSIEVFNTFARKFGKFHKTVCCPAKFGTKSKVDLGNRLQGRLSNAALLPHFRHRLAYDPSTASMCAYSAFFQLIPTKPLEVFQRHFESLRISSQTLHFCSFGSKGEIFGAVRFGCWHGPWVVSSLVVI